MAKHHLSHHEEVEGGKHSHKHHKKEHDHKKSHAHHAVKAKVASHGHSKHHKSK